MDAQTFEAEMAEQGYSVVHRTLAAGLAVDAHDHAWDTKGLVVSGAFTIDCDGDSRTYRAGDIFELGAGIAHTESTGPDGAELLVGRRTVD